VNQTTETDSEINVPVVTRTTVARNKLESVDKTRSETALSLREIAQETNHSSRSSRTNTLMTREATLKAVRDPLLRAPTVEPTLRMPERLSSSSVALARTLTKITYVKSLNVMESSPSASTFPSRVLPSSNTLTMPRLSRPSLVSTALSSMDVSSRFNSLVTNLTEIVPKEPDVSVDLLPLPSSAVTLDSVLTKTALLVSLNKSALLPKSELLKVMMAVPRDSVTLNSRKKLTPRELSINSMVKTSMDVTSDLIYPPTVVAVEAEVAVVVAVASEEAVASVVAIVEATEEAEASEAVAIDSAATEEAAVAASEVVTDHPTVTVTAEKAVATEEVATETTETADPLTVVTVTDATEVASEVETDAVEAATEEVVEVVSNGIE